MDAFETFLAYVYLSAINTSGFCLKLEQASQKYDSSRLLSDALSGGVLVLLYCPVSCMDIFH